MTKLFTRGLCLMVGFSLVAGCNGGGNQSLLPPSASGSLPTVNGSAASESHQLASRGEPFARGYTITDLGTLGGTFSTNNDVNNRGAAAGESTLAGDTVLRGFLWNGGHEEGGRLIDVGHLPAGPNSDAHNVNERSQVSGAADGAPSTADSNACFGASAQDSHAYVWQNGIMTDLGTLGGKSSTGQWINNRGQMAGASQINAADPNGFVACHGSPGAQIVRAFLFENGKMIDIGTLGGYDAFGNFVNDRGQVGGGSDVTTTKDPSTGYPRHHPFLWTHGVMRDLGTLGGEFGYDNAITNNGSVVGITTLAGEQHIHAFLWQNGVMTDLGVLKGDTDSNALGMNSSGKIVGFSATSNSMRAFIRQNGVMTDLNTLISPHSGFQLAIGSWINDAGEIAAQALVERTGQMHAVLLKPSDNDIRGKAGGAPLTPSLRKYLLRRIGYGPLKFLTSNH